MYHLTNRWVHFYFTLLFEKLILKFTFQPTLKCVLQPPVEQTGKNVNLSGQSLHDMYTTKIT